MNFNNDVCTLMNNFIDKKKQDKDFVNNSLKLIQHQRSLYRYQQSQSITPYELCNVSKGCENNTQCENIDYCEQHECNNVFQQYNKCLRIFDNHMNNQNIGDKSEWYTLNKLWFAEIMRRTRDLN
jgi:hypothetical protein